MSFLRYSTRMLQGASPVGVLVGGTVLFLGLPLLRKGLRCAAVLTARAIYSVTDEAKKVTSASRESMEDIISEAKTPDTCCPSCSAFKQSAADLRKRPRRLAVAATVGVLNASDKAKSLYKDASQQVKTIIEEAKSTKISSDPPETDIQEDESPPHSSEADDLEYSKDDPK